jgi:hypothetical protein
VQQLPEAVFIQEPINAGQLMSGRDVLAIQRQQVFYARDGGSNVKGVVRGLGGHDRCRHDRTGQSSDNTAAAAVVGNGLRQAHTRCAIHFLRHDVSAYAVTG